MLSPHLTRRLIEHYVGHDVRAPDGPRPMSSSPMSSPPSPAPSLPGLTLRELDVLAAVARGLSNLEISAEM